MTKEALPRDAAITGEGVSGPRHASRQEILGAEGIDAIEHDPHLRARVIVRIDLEPPAALSKRTWPASVKSAFRPIHSSFWLPPP